MMKESTITISELGRMLKDGKLILSHNATRQGYLTRKNPNGKIYEYSGKYGKGYIHATPRYDTSRYVTYSYYIEK